MRYLLDSNIFIASFLRADRQINSKLALHFGQYGISSVVLFELYFGAYYSDYVERNANRVATHDLPVVEFDENDARAAGKIRAELKRVGMPIGPYDLLIAGQALARGLIVVTNNVSEFARVPGLVVEDWTG